MYLGHLPLHNNVKNDLKFPYFHICFNICILSLNQIIVTNLSYFYNKMGHICTYKPNYLVRNIQYKYDDENADNCKCWKGKNVNYKVSNLSADET